MKYIASILLLLFATQAYSADNPKVNMQTSIGTIVIELNAEKAPKSVANFLRYVEKGFYNGTIFHRVIKDFMIQGGGFTPDYKKKPTHAAIKNEAQNGLKNERGTIAMARTGAPHSATGQFFINTVNNKFLNHTAPNIMGWGYTVFGKVTKGMDVVDKIRAVKTGRGGQFPSDVPQTPVIIEKVSLVKAEKPIAKIKNQDK